MERKSWVLFEEQDGGWEKQPVLQNHLSDYSWIFRTRLILRGRGGFPCDAQEALRGSILF